MYRGSDGGWGWVVTLVAFMINFFVDGISYSFGILFKHLLEQFNESKSLTSWIISVFNGTYVAIGPVASILVSAFGMRKVAIFGALLASISFLLSSFSPNVQMMIVFYGFLGGVGLGLAYLPAIVLVGHYFTKKRALASGIACCGSGVGGFVFAPLMEYLIDTFYWQGAVLVVSAIVLNGVPLGALLIPVKIKANEWAKEQKGSSTGICRDVSAMFDFGLLKSPTTLLYGLSCFFCMLGYYIPFTFLPKLADDFGLTSQRGAMLISIIGITTTVSRVAAGWLADRPCIDPIKVNGVMLTLGGVATMFVPRYSNFETLATYCAFFGTCIAVYMSYRPVILSELLGIEKLTSSFGLVCMCEGLSALIGAPIAGALSDNSGDYDGAFYLAGATLALSGMICFLLNRVNRWERRRAQIKENNNVFNISHEISIIS